MKTIQELLQIEVKQLGHVQYDPLYEADSKVMPGTPPVGKNSTYYGAIYDLLNRLYSIECYKKIMKQRLFEDLND